MILADEFILGIFADGAELIVHVGNRALDVRYRHDGVLIESKLLISQFLECSLAGSEAFFQGVLGSLTLSDIGTDGHILARFTLIAQGRDDGGIHPVDGTVLGAVPDFGVPDLSIGNGVIHLLEELSRVVAGVEDAMILADEFISGILADGAELIVDVSNRALDVGHRHDCVLIESELLIGQFLLCLVAGDQSFPQRLLCSPTLFSFVQ
jgi:hypothetical protein